MTFEEKQQLKKKYDYFASFLLYFLLDTYLPEDEWDDYNTIKKYVDEDTVGDILNTISQGKAILDLQEFPVDWIGDITNRFPFKMSNEATEQDYYDWVKWMIDTLEVEAKKAGKL